MMKIKHFARTVMLLCGGMISGVVFAATPSASMLANTCVGCHGPNGSSTGPASPTIAGMSKGYFVEAMKSYKEGTRPSTIMTRIAKGYTDEEVELMAGFFESQKFVRHAQKVDGGKASLGEKLHKKYCEKCHEDGGRSSEDDSGILAGQWERYLRFTMEDFTGGSREMEKKMKKKLEELQSEHGDKGIDALINFYASQK